MIYIRLKDLVKPRKPTDETGSDDNIISDYGFIYRIPVANGMKVLDVGCGTGRDLRCILRNYPNCECVGIDQFNLIPPDERPEIKLVQSDVTKLPFEDNYFDVVYANSVFDEMTDEQVNAVLSEMKRVGKDVWYTELNDDFKTFDTKHPNFHKEKFAIIGSPRTGTTLLLRLLNKQNDIFCGNEQQSHDYANHPEMIYTLKPIVGLKLPFGSEWLLQNDFWKDSQIIFTHRDPVDTVASYDLMIMGNEQNMLDKIIDTIKNSTSDSDFSKTMSKDLELLPTYSDYRVACGAIYYKWLMGRESLFPNRLDVVYEDFVTNPKQTIQNICDFLGAKMNDFDSTQVFTSSIGKGYKQYSPEQVQLIKDICG